MIRIGVALFNCNRLLSGYRTPQKFWVDLSPLRVMRRDLKRVTLETMVQEKAIAFPTDSRHYNRARERLVRWNLRGYPDMRKSDSPGRICLLLLPDFSSFPH